MKGRTPTNAFVLGILLLMIVATLSVPIVHPVTTQTANGPVTATLSSTPRSAPARVLTKTPYVADTLVLANNTLVHGNFLAGNGVNSIAAAYDSSRGEVFVVNQYTSNVRVISTASNTVVATIPVGVKPVAAVYDGAQGEVFVANSYSNNVSVISDTSNTVVSTVPVGSSPWGVAYDSAKGEVFVANDGSSNVSVISDTSNTVVSTVPVYSSPWGIAYDSAKGEVFVANNGADNLSVISDSSNTVVGAVTGTPSPEGLTYDSAKGELFVADFGSDEVSVVSDASNAVLGTAAVGIGPVAVAYDSGQGEIFVSDSNCVGWPCSLPGSVSVVNDTTNNVVTTIPGGYNPEGLAYGNLIGEIFVANEYSDNVSVINDGTNTVVANIVVGIGPTNVAYDSGKAELFVPSWNTHNVTVINDSTNTAMATIPVGVAPVGAVYDSAKGEVFVINSYSNSVSVIDDGTNGVVSTIPVGGEPTGAAYDSGKGEVFVADSQTASVTVINDTTNSAATTIGVGDYPNEMAYDSGKGEIFVVNTNSDDVSVINDKTNGVVNTINVGPNPVGATYDSGKGEIFVANYDSSSVSVISDSTNSVVATIPVGAGPYGLAYDGHDGMVLVANWVTSNVSAISDTSDSVTSTVNVGAMPEYPAYDTSNGQVYLDDYGQGTVSVIAFNSSTPVPLYPSIGASTLTGQAPLKVNFTASVSGGSSPYSYSWTFGDGHSGSGAATSHTYNSTGTFNVTLTASDGNGDHGQTNATVVVHAAVLHPTIGASTLTGGVPLVVNFTASATGGTTPYLFSWVFGDGHGGAGGPIKHTYNSTGTYTVTLTAVDLYGGYGQTNATVVVYNVLLHPTISASALSGVAPLSVNFTAGVTGGTSPYMFSWTFGDGHIGSGATIHHSYNLTGTYEVNLTANDSYGDYGQVSTSIVVYAVALHPTLSASPLTGGAPLVVNFKANVTGGTSPYQFSWAFGDGHVGSGATVQHTYNLTGTYKVTLTVNDSYGGYGQANTTVVAYAVSVHPTISVSTLKGGAPLVVSFNANATGGTSPYQFSWAFGDGHLGSGAAVQHTYNVTGTYQVTLTASDSHGHRGQTNTTIVVVAAVLHPSISASPLTGGAPLVVSFTANATGGTSPYQFSWIFGDGHVGTGVSIRHTYNSTGTYKVTLTASNSYGGYGQANTTVVVYGIQPGNQTGSNALELFISAAPATGPAPLPVHFQAAVGDGKGPYTFTWEFGDNTTESTSGTAPTSMVTHTYSSQGTYVATLIVGDSSGDQATTAVFVAAYSNTSGGENQLAAFVTTLAMNGTAPLTVTFSPAVIGGTAPYSLTWSFGDGTPSFTESNSDPITHTYSTPGAYTPQLSVTDARGEKATWSTGPSGIDHPVTVSTPSGKTSTPPLLDWTILAVVVVVAVVALLMLVSKRGRSKSLRQAMGKEKAVTAPPKTPQIGGEDSEPDPLGDMA
jgi:YVTN family beta-propeller protein